MVPNKHNPLPRAVDVDMPLFHSNLNEKRNLGRKISQFSLSWILLFHKYVHHTQERYFVIHNLVQ